MLKENQTIRLMQLGLCRVVRVSDCAAHVVPITKKQRVIVDKLHNKKVEFEVPSKGFDIAINSEVEIISDNVGGIIDDDSIQ